MDSDNMSLATSNDNSISDLQGLGIRKPSQQQMTLLPEEFSPGENDVICGRGKKCYNHVGNERFRKRVMTMLDEYSRAKSKLDKSGVLATVVDQIRAFCDEGGFVKQNEDGRWYEVGDFLAREKTSQAFRDALHERYKSSNVAKKKRRQEEQAKTTDKFQKIGIGRAHSDTSAIEWLALSQNMNGLNVDSARGYDIFQGTNFDMMARLNRLTREENMSASFNENGRRRFLPPARSLSTNNALQGTRNFGARFANSGPPMMPQRSNSGMAMQRSDPLFGNLLGAGISNNVASLIDIGEGNNSQEMMRHQTDFSLPLSPSQVMSEPFIRQPQRLSSRRDMDYPGAYQEIMENSLLGNMHHGQLAELAEERPDQMLHRSMPNVTRSWDASVSLSTTGESLQSSLHHSTPNIHFSDAEVCEDDEDSFSGDLLEPIPLDEITPRPMAKSSVSDLFKRNVCSMTLSPTSPSVDASSKDLIACLEKMTGSSIRDSNPFEPLPLRPEDDDSAELVQSNFTFKLPMAEEL